MQFDGTSIDITWEREMRALKLCIPSPMHIKMAGEKSRQVVIVMLSFGCYSFLSFCRSEHYVCVSDPHAYFSVFEKGYEKL